jgi:hypothetical protein
MFEWFQIEIRTIAKAGETEILYSHTPEEFVAELNRRNERIFVVNKSCSECTYTPDRAASKELVRSLTDESLACHRCPECFYSAIARRMNRNDVPDPVHCYGFYYQFWHRNKYLLAAKEAGLIEFYGVEKLPTTQDLGYRPIVTHFY